jgi:hypothetical protein
VPGTRVILSLALIGDQRARRVGVPIARAMSVLLLALVAVLLMRTYIGHAPGPYGVCAGSSGRPVPCALLKRR